jgi:hypothetical protein
MSAILSNPRLEEPMTSERMQKASLGAAERRSHGRISKESLTVDGVTVTRVTFGVGARWSQDAAAAAGTVSCVAPHVAVVLSGALRVRMDDGAEDEFRRDDVMLLPPGHDAWTVGREPCVFLELSQGYDRYAGAGAPSGERFG